MPYIPSDERQNLDKFVDEMIASVNGGQEYNGEDFFEFLKTVEDGKVEGNVNYFLSTFLNKYYTEKNYKTYNRIQGILAFLMVLQNSSFHEFEGDLVIETLLTILDITVARLNDIIATFGILDCVSKEFYRRNVAPYEDTKISLNGDVF